MRILITSWVAYLMLLSTIFMSCENTPIAEMDERLIPYIAAFSSEAQLRHVDIDVAHLSGFITSIGDASAQCAHGVTNTPALRIDATAWSRSSEIQREFLIFHELGHCLLDRRHLDEKSSDGICLSIMHSTSQACTNAYGVATRKDYLDELFLTKAEEP